MFELLFLFGSLAGGTFRLLVSCLLSGKTKLGFRNAL